MAMFVRDVNALVVAAWTMAGSAGGKSAAWTLLQEGAKAVSAKPTLDQAAVAVERLVAEGIINPDQAMEITNALVG